MPDAWTIGFGGFIGLILLGIPVLVAVSMRRLAQRRRELRAFAAGHGFVFSAKERLPEELRALPYFTVGAQGFTRIARAGDGLADTFVIIIERCRDSGFEGPECRTST